MIRMYFDSGKRYMEFNNSIEYNLFLNRLFDVTELLRTGLEEKLLSLEHTLYVSQEQVDKVLGVVKLDSHKVLESYNKYKL